MQMFLEENSNINGLYLEEERHLLVSETGQGILNISLLLIPIHSDSQTSRDKSAEPNGDSNQFVKDVLRKMKSEPRSEIGSMVEAEMQEGALYTEQQEVHFRRYSMTSMKSRYQDFDDSDNNELDTIGLTKKVKEFLATNGISQRVRIDLR